MRLVKFLILAGILHLVILMIWAHIGGSKISKSRTIQEEKKVTLGIKKEAQERKAESKKVESLDAPLRLSPNQTVEQSGESQEKFVEEIPELKPEAKTQEPKEEKQESSVLKEQKQPEPEKKEIVTEQKIETPVIRKFSQEELTKSSSTKSALSENGTSDSEQTYAKFLQSIDAKSIRGLPTPDLTVWYQDEREIISVAKYFGLKFVVYKEPSEGQSPVFIEVTDSSIPKFERLEKLDLNHYSNRVRQHRDHPFFNTLLSKAVEEFKLDAKRSRLIVLVPKEVDLYFRYKQIECAKRNDIDPFSVKVTNAKYHRTRLDNWILVIDTMELRDGRTTKVEDFELKKFM